MSALSQSRGSASPVKVSQDLMLVGLRLSGWLATNTLATLGIATLLFFVLGSFTLRGMMVHLDNLTSRFLAAEAARQGQFEAIVFGAVLVAFVLIGFFRRTSLLAAFDVTGEEQ